LRSGDLLTFFTDGVVEAESPGRVRFGVTRALQVIRSDRDKSAAEIIESLHQEVLGFCRSQPPQDDITIVIVKVTS
jgi:phosphoserine phosphatase RsbU/P